VLSDIIVAQQKDIRPSLKTIIDTSNVPIIEGSDSPVDSSSFLLEENVRTDHSITTEVSPTSQPLPKTVSIPHQFEQVSAACRPIRNVKRPARFAKYVMRITNRNLFLQRTMKVKRVYVRYPSRERAFCDVCQVYRASSASLRRHVRSIFHRALGVCKRITPEVYRCLSFTIF